MTKLFSIIDILQKNILLTKMTQKKSTKRTFCFFSLNETALAENEAHLSVTLKMVYFSNNTHLDTGLNFSMHTVQHGRWHAGTSIRNTVPKFLLCSLRGYVHWLILTEKHYMGLDLMNIEAIPFNHNIPWLVAKTCPESTVGHFIVWHRRVGTIHSTNH